MKKYFAILDTETNSLPNKNIPDAGLPLQVSMIITNLDFIPLKTINIFITQDYLDMSSVAVHGFDRDKLESLGALEPREAYMRIFNDAPINWDEVIAIAHNASFDKGVLERFALQCNNICPIDTYLDTFKYFRNNKDPNRANNKLETIVNFLGGEQLTIRTLTKSLYGNSEGYHDARYDTAALLFVVNKIKDEFLKYYTNEIS